VKPITFMVIAGEESGDSLAAGLVQAIRLEFARQPAITTSDYQPTHSSLEPRFFGAGGAHLRKAGVEILVDLTKHSVIGISDVIRKYFHFRKIMSQLCRAALERQPDVIVGVDFSGFNRRFVHRIREGCRRRSGWFQDWQPKIVQYVSPQVWASREGRAYQMAKDYDLVLSLFPFEKEWYEKRVPGLRVEFVGDPMAERYAAALNKSSSEAQTASQLLLLPGSRTSELARHLPVMLDAERIIRGKLPMLKTVMVLPSESLLAQAKAFATGTIDVRVGGLQQALAEADLAIASTGTVTRECAYMGVPTVAMYKTSWMTFQIGKRLVKVKYLAMPNLLADDVVFPEFVQDDATAENIAKAALELLQSPERRKQIKRNLAEIVRSLGGPGATERAARAVMGLVA
jgi:lipid-A-disaccharide synthase